MYVVYYYARFDICSYYCFRETHFNARLEVNNARLDVKSQQSHSSVKSGQGYWLVVCAYRVYGGQLLCKAWH